MSDETGSTFGRLVERYDPDRGATWGQLVDHYDPERGSTFGQVVGRLGGGGNGHNFNVMVGWTQLPANQAVPSGTAILRRSLTGQTGWVTAGFWNVWNVVALDQSISGAPNVEVDFGAPRPSGGNLPAGAWVYAISAGGGVTTGGAADWEAYAVLAGGP